MEEQKYKIVRHDGDFWTALGWRTDGKPCVYTEEQLPSTLDGGYFKLNKGKTVEESYYKSPCSFSPKVNIVKAS